jgi:hypothetical protein
VCVYACLGERHLCIHLCVGVRKTWSPGGREGGREGGRAREFSLVWGMGLAWYMRERGKKDAVGGSGGV